MHRTSVLLLLGACGGTESPDTSGGLDTGVDAPPGHVASTATGAFATGDYAIRIDVASVTDASGVWLESVRLNATDMAAYNDMTLETADVYLDDTRVDVPAPVVGWDYEGAPGTALPARIHGRATVWNGDAIEFDYDMGLVEPHTIDAPTAGATLPLGADVEVRWSPSGGGVAWSMGLFGQPAETEWASDDVGSGTIAGSGLTEAREDTLWVARSGGEVLDGARNYFAHLHEARVPVVVGP